MADQTRKAEQFRALHLPGKRSFSSTSGCRQRKGRRRECAKAIATSSWSVANANGFSDGEQTS